MGEPAYAGVYKKLSTALDIHMRATDDPFRHLRNDLLMPADGYVRVFRR